MDYKMIISKTLWCLLLVATGVTQASTNGEFPEGGCDLSLTQPCRSNSSLCVPHQHVRDGFIDCPDGSDEDCPEDWFICSDLSRCIDRQFIQDGVPECDDESDEACDEWQHECLCGLPRCVDKALVGDGNLDCSEGSDELAIEKKSYICPSDLLIGQELLRKKRQLEKEDRRNVGKGVVTNFYTNTQGASLGVLTSTVFSFVNKGTTSEYLTQIEGRTVDGRYAQVTSVTSRTFFAIPTRLNKNQVNGLVSSIVKTTISSGYTTTIVSRIYHTSIDGTYAQLVETETIGYVPTKTVSMNIVTILQGQELHGTLISHPDSSIATLQFSHLEGSLNPEPVAQEIVTVTGTYGKFIRDGHNAQAPTTYSVFTGSYIKDFKTYVFFFGNSALPSEHNSLIEGGSALKMKQGIDKNKVILDMEKDMEVIMPSELKMLDMESKNDLLIGEGMVDGHKVDGLFIADSEGFDVKGAKKSGEGGIKMLTVTIGQPGSVTSTEKNTATKVHDNFSFFDEIKSFGNEEDNELDTSLLRGRKVDIHGNEVFAETDKINPTRPLPQDIPTFVIQEPDQHIADIMLREQIMKQNSDRTPQKKVKEEIVTENSEDDKFNIFSILQDSEFPTVTYYGFADFTTTIENTVVVFTPNSRTNVNVDTETKSSLNPRVIPTKIPAENQANNIHPIKNTFSTVTTKVFNTVDLYPSGLVSSIGGTFVNDDITTLFTTLVYGTYIQGQYAQVVRSTSSIIYLVSKQASSLEPTKLNDITMTKSPIFDSEVSDKSQGNIGTKPSSLFDSIFDNLQEDNALGRKVAGEASDQNVIADDVKMEKEIEKPGLTVINEKPSTVTYTLYTTYMKDGTTSVVTNYKTTTASPHFGTITKLSPATLTHHTTQLIKGATKVQSSLEVVQSSVPPPSSIDNLFSDIFGSVATSANEDVSQTFSETVTESSAQSTTESPEVSLDSSLNPEEDVNALFFPRTYYTTYTYFTTYHRLNTSSIVSSLDTVTNIITDEKQLEDYKALTPAIPTYPVTYWTTYTYWTTLVKDNSSIVTSSKKTISNVVNLTANETPTVVNEVLPIEATAIVPLIDLKQTPTVDVTTYYTTYTYYTTATIGESTVITSRHETESSVVTGTRSLVGQTNVLERPFGLLFDHSETETSTLRNHRTGLLSTIRGSTVIGGITTMFSTNVYGTFVDGLYVQIQSTTSDILASSSIFASDLKKGGVLTVDAGSIIANEVTTHYTTQTVGTYIKGIYMTKLLSTSRLEGTSSFVTETNPTQTGIVREIIGSVIYGTKTTFYHSTVLGTLIDGIYAQKIESTSRFVSGPSIAFDVLAGQEDKLSFENVSPLTILEPSIQSAINPTPVLFATESLESVQSETTQGEVTETPKHKNRLSFPIRTSSKRRNDEFPFIKRTSTFSKEEALSKVLVAAPEEETSIAQKSTTLSKTTKTEQEPTHSFRFGNLNAQPTRRFRFQEKGQSKLEPTARVPFTQEKSVARSIKPTEEHNKPIIQEKSKPSVEKTKPLKEENKPEHAEEPDTFRQFRFGAKGSTAGTRSTLPFPKRKLNDTAEVKKPATGLLHNQPQTTTAKPKISHKDAVSDASKSKRPNPFSFPTRTEDKRKVSRPTKPEPADRGSFNNILRPKPIPTTSPAPKTTRGPRPKLGGLLPRRRPATPKLSEGESVIDTVYINEDGSEVLEGDLPGSVDYANDDIVYDDAVYEYDEPLSRKKRQVDDFGSRTTSRGAKRFTRNQESNADLSNISPSAPKNEKQAFTLTNPRLAAARVRTNPRTRPSSPSKVEKPERPGPPVRSPVSRLSPSKSRTSLPFKPRENIQKVAPPVETLQRGTFRRPESNNRFKISNRFTPDEKINSNNQARRPSVHTANRNRVAPRPPPSKNNPIQSFLDRPKPPPKVKEPESMSKFDGIIDITDTLTVTREVPVTTTIPLLENGETIEKEVITASYTTELIFPDQVTKTEINGVIKYLLSTVESKQKVTRVFIQPIVTTFVTYTPVFLDGQRTSIAHTIPSTIYNIVTATGPKNGNDVQDLLKLLLLQQQQQNPLLAALGIGGQQPSVHVHTKTLVTTITSLTSTEIPIIFRGKPIRTTVVETIVKEITTTELSTETLLGQGSNHNPLGQILPLILQNQLNRKAREISQTELPSLENIGDETTLKDKYYPVYIDEDGVRPLADLESIFNYESDSLRINSAVNEIEANEYVEATPPLRNVYKLNKDSVSRNSFLSKGPAEFTPLRRKVRSAQRGEVRQRVPIRQLGSRKIKTSADDQILQDISGDKERNVINNNLAPTTFFTTFTYYTTLIDDLDREFVQSSEETITQVATFGHIKFDDFTRTKPTSVLKPIVHTSIEMFKPEDAIIPGMPRPVPDPIFKEPEPPHGPIIRHGSVTSRRRVRPGKSDAIKINLKGQSTNIGLAMPVTVLPRDSDSADSIIDGVLQSSDDLSPTHEVMELEETDVEQPISDRPGEQKRVRITLTKRRPVRITNTADIVDQTTVDAGGRKRVVLTRRLPQAHATAVASPVDPFIGTVNTFYTVYSYVYSLYENSVPFSVSTRVVTVSNAVQPTQVAVPLRFQTIQPTSNLYTIEEGKVVATLGERIKNGYTTQIYLHSATLASIRPGILQRPTEVQDTLRELPIFDYDSVEPTGLQSSLQEIENSLATSTPLFTRHSSRKTQKSPLIKAPTKIFSTHAKESFTVNKSSLKAEFDVTQTRKRGDIRFASKLSKSHITPTLAKEFSLSSARRNQLNTQRRRPSDTTTEPIDITEAELESTLKNFTKKITLEKENQPTFPEKTTEKKSNFPDIFANIFNPVVEISTEKQDVPVVENQSTTVIPTEAPSTFLTVDDKFQSSASPIVTELPSTAKPPRPSVRRDDIPIVRRPSSDELPKGKFAEHRLRFTTTHKTIDDSTTSSTEGTPLTSPLSLDDPKKGLHVDDYYDNEYYDEYDSNVTGNVTEASQPTEADNSADEFKEAIDIVSDKKEKGSVPLDIFNTFRSKITPALFESMQTKSVNLEKLRTQISLSEGMYTTYTTTKFLPILGGEQTISLTLVTSSLLTQKDSNLRYTKFLGINPSERIHMPETLLSPKSLHKFDLFNTHTKDLIENYTPLESYTTYSQSQLRVVPSKIISTPSTKLFDAVSSEIHTTLTSKPSSTFQTENNKLLSIDFSDFFDPKSKSVSDKIPTSLHLSGLRSGGRAVIGSIPPDQIIGGSPSPVGTFLSISGRQNLATKIMNNGVEVIVAEDKTKSDPSITGLVRATVNDIRRPITLPPSTLSNQMLLLASTHDEQMFQTYYTTFTYYNTIMSDGKPTVISSRETISNIISTPYELSGNYVEKTKINLATSTYLTTQTYTRTVGNLFSPETITSEEVITQVVVTEAPAVIRSRVQGPPAVTTLVSKTYFTTFTYYRTYVNEHDTSIDTETVVSSDVVTETSVTIPKSKQSVISFTKAPETAFDGTPVEIFATKTYYTTSTYFTTILEGDATLTSSHIEVTSNVLTEPVTTVLRTKDLLSVSNSFFKDEESAINADNYESTEYISLRNNVYKQLRTLLATFTHYTTLVGGEVHSNEVTKTQVVTSIITTTSVPTSLLVKPDRTFTNIEATSTSNKLFAEGLFDTLFGTTSSVDLEPSYIDSTSQLGVTGTSVGHVSLHSSSDIKESSGQATVLIEEGNESGTFVVKDSTTSATILVRPTEEIASSLNLFDQLFASNELDVEEASKSITLLASSQLPVVETTVPPLRTDLELTSSQVSQVQSLSSVRLDSPPSTPVVEEGAADSVSTDETSADKEPQSDSGKFGFGFNPMLTAAVAGLIGNTFAGRLAGQAAVGNRRKSDHILPKNAIVAAENEPLLIPIGGVGASLSRSHMETISPDNGFIPLRQQFQQDLEENLEVVNVRTHPTVSFESFGPAFKPPLTTQTGFTAMTKDVSPTKVSIISGEETIFFGGFKNLNLPPPGKPVMQKEIQNSEDLQPHPVPVNIDDPSEKSISHFSLTTSETQQIDHKVRPAPRPSLIQFDLEDGGENIYASETDRDHQVELAPIELQSTLNNGDATVGPVGGTGILSTDLPFRFKNEGDRTTIVKGSSTVMSGDTTIFDSLFTKPVKDNTQSPSVSVVRGLNGKLTKYITRTENSADAVVTTKTHYDFIDGFPISRTEVITHSRGLKTLVSTIVDSKTQVNELVSKTSIESAIKPTAISESKTRLTTVTVTPAKDNDLNLISNVADIPGANLGYAEENEISRVVESKSPDQDLSPLSISDRCNSQCGKDEICGSFDQDHVCVCKPRYSRRSPNDVCKKSKSFQVTVLLDRLKEHKLSFSEEMTNSSHPSTQFLIKEVKSGIDKALMDSDLGNKYHSNTILSFEETITDTLKEPSLTARVKVDVADDETDEEVSFSSFIPFARKNKLNEHSVQSALEESLAGSNYSIGGGEVFARQAALNAEDFDECESSEHNDCHVNADCINTGGSFTCACKETFIDVSDNKNKEPGRQCVDSNTCSYCNFHGKCQENSERELSCLCNDWFSGEQCEVNMKVMLIAVVSVGAFLLVLLTIFICFCCCRSKDKKEQPPFLRASSGRREPSTLDRRAMIHDSSSECSEEVVRRPSAALLDASKLPPMPRTPQADYSIGRRSGISSMSKDRSVTVHTSVPPVLIPRIKGYNNQASNRSYGEKENLKTAEATLVDILDGTSQSRIPHDIVPNPSVHSFRRVPPINHKSRSRERLDDDAHHHHTSRYQHPHDEDEEPSVRSRSNSRPRYHHNDGSTYRSRSTDRLDRSTQDLTSDFEGNSLRYGNRTVSQARSYDETTIRPPIRSFKNESFQSRDISSQIISDGMPTNAERDGNSTIVYPPMQLYRPVREADSMSDLTSHPKNDFF